MATMAGIRGLLIILCAMELQPAYILADASLRSIDLYLLMVFQEANAMLKNLGIYYGIYRAASAFIGRPVSDELRQAADARRRVIAPFDCLAELIAPFPIAVYVILTDPRAPPLIVMCFALVVRIVFTVIEVLVERRVALYNDNPAGGGMSTN